MISARVCIFCRLLRSNSKPFIIKYATGIPKSSSSSSTNKNKIEDISPKSTIDWRRGKPIGKGGPFFKPSDLVKENIFTIPNALCLSRIALSPLLCYFVVKGDYEFGLAIFAYAAVTDLLDGWIARSFPGQQSVLGSALDPFADKTLVAALVLSLTYVGLIPLPLTALIVGRDIVLMTTGFVMRYVTMEPPKTLARYFDVTAPSIRIKPTSISKFNTGVQLCMLGLSLAAPVFQYANHPAMTAVWYFTAGTTVASGLSYLFAKDTYEVLRRRAKPAPDKEKDK